MKGSVISSLWLALSHERYVCHSQGSYLYSEGSYLYIIMKYFKDNLFSESCFTVLRD